MVDQRKPTISDLNKFITINSLTSDYIRLFIFLSVYFIPHFKHKHSLNLKIKRDISQQYFKIVDFHFVK